MSPSQRKTPPLAGAASDGTERKGGKRPDPTAAPTPAQAPEHRGELHRFISWALMLGGITPARVVVEIERGE
jgi:hypothetical protein